MYLSMMAVNGLDTRIKRHRVLLSNLQMAVTCFGLGGIQEIPGCEPWQSVATARPGGTYRAVWDTLSPAPAHLRDFSKVKAEPG